MDDGTVKTHVYCRECRIPTDHLLISVQMIEPDSRTSLRWKCQQCGRIHAQEFWGLDTEHFRPNRTGAMGWVNGSIRSLNSAEGGNP